MKIFSEFLGNSFFWLFLAGLAAAVLTIRAAHSYRDKAVFTNDLVSAESLFLRARVFYGLFAMSLLAVITGLGIIVFQVLQVVRPQTVMNDPVSASSFTPTALLPSATPTQRTMTATPAPTPLPSPTPLPTEGLLIAALIGNTNFQGVNCRETAGLEGRILAKLSNGTEVLIVAGATVEADGYLWQQVQLEDGRLGWIVADFLLPESTPVIP